MKGFLKRMTIGFIALLSFSLFTACFAFGEDTSPDSGSTVSSSNIEDSTSTDESSSSITDSSVNTTDSTLDSTADSTDSSTSEPPIDETPDDIPDTCVEHDYVLTNAYNGERHYLECSVCGERMSETHEFVSFSVDATGAQTDYVAGESFNLDGLRVSIECECGRVQAIEDYEIAYPTSGQAHFVLGDGYVTVVYGDNRATVDITVHTFKGIRITTPPTDTTYEEGETFQKYGMVLSAYCDCGYERAVVGYKVTYPAAGQRSFRMGDTYVTITYGEWSIKLEVTVKKYGGGNWSGIVPF